MDQNNSEIVYSVSETLIDGELYPSPRITKYSIDFLIKLVISDNFHCVTISTENQNLAFFKTYDVAEEYLDEICNSVLLPTQQ